MACNVTYSFQDRQSITPTRFTSTQHSVRLKKKKKGSRANERTFNNLWSHFLPWEIKQYVPGSFLCSYPLQGLILLCGERLFRAWKQHCNWLFNSQTISSSDRFFLAIAPTSKYHSLTVQLPSESFLFPQCETLWRDLPLLVTTENRNHIESNHREPHTLFIKRYVLGLFPDITQQKGFRFSLEESFSNRYSQVLN